ncbi:hypothetical protein APR41_15110 [Salegentibacter salinarum]|uniref:DUF4304 domain-containing protein n=1 Tax=Salegentibacter salinarum TaxID=447422 RepID=A0A2N0TZ34_9FLAO|nr:hypothetical protein [Salegentibacter salinarum]PKD20001.1 hypothetical protein APR41_15110 [Salegentibacter salinarum]SKB97240.1 hypothetical protein SAMN05660903_03571 [Salegentibacter salinarum]
MESKDFRELIERNSKKLQLEKYKTTYYTESADSIVFLVLIKSNYSKNYYLRLKTEIKPLEKDFNKEDFIKHDISDILVSLDSESPEIFDLENHLTDFERGEKMNKFFANNVEQWIKAMLSKESIIEKSNKEDLVLLPYTKSKLGLK